MNQTTPPRRPAIIVHGGAGRFPETEIDAAREGCRLAAARGWAVLTGGGTALAAAEAAVIALEDNPLFNAGTGAVLNRTGGVELDASIMDGPTVRAGCVGAVCNIKNPIILARKILEHGQHVLLVGDGARAFAEEVGLALCDENDLKVPRQQRRWQERHGTVGAVAFDQDGHLAAATSTGGIFDKLPGRVGDSAVIGSGTYADTVAGISCTGSGEAIIRVVLGKTVATLIADGSPAQHAAQAGIALLHDKTGADAGLIVIDHRGQLGYACNTPAMPVAWTQDGHVQTVI